MSRMCRGFIREWDQRKRRLVLYGLVVFLSASSAPGSFGQLTISEVYSGCRGDSVPPTGKSCLGFSKARSCMVTTNCATLLTFKKGDNGSGVIHYQLASRAPAWTGKSRWYAAIGFSKGPLMGADAVVSCIKYGTTFGVTLSFNTNKLSNRPEPSATSSSILSQVTAAEENGQLLCNFTLSSAFTLQGVSFDLERHKYYLLTARGASRSLTRLDYHSWEGTAVSSRSVNFQGLNQFMVYILEQRSLQRKAVMTHIILMVLAFTTFIPTSMLSARFLKESHVRIRVFQRRVWFTVHVAGQILTLLALFVAMLGIWIILGTYKHQSWKKSLAHYILGIIILVLVTISSILGFVKSQTDTKEHMVFNYALPFAHWLLGVIILTLGIILIFMAPLLHPNVLKGNPDLLCEAPWVLLIIWLVVYLLVYTLFTAMLFLRERQEQRDGVIPQINFMMPLLAMSSKRLKRSQSQVAPNPAQPLSKRGSSKILSYHDYQKAVTEHLEQRQSEKSGGSISKSEPPTKTSADPPPPAPDESKKAPGPAEEQPAAEMNKVSFETKAKKKKSSTRTERQRLFADFLGVQKTSVVVPQDSKGLSQHQLSLFDIDTKGLDGITHFSNNNVQNVRAYSSIYLRTNPGRAFWEFPLKIHSFLENPHTARIEIILGVFVLVSLALGSGLCYLLIPSSSVGKRCFVTKRDLL